MTKLNLTAIKKQLKSNRQAEIPAFLGNLSGTVQADKSGNVYATLLNGEVLTVYNGMVPNVARLPIVIGYGGTDKLHILRSRDVYVTPPFPDVPGHASLHTFPGVDTVPIRSEQFLPGLVTPKAGLTVRIYSCVYELADGFHALATQDLDLTSSVPGSGALYARLEADDTGAVTISLGSTVDSRAELEFSDIPAADPEKYSLAAVKLYIGQTNFIFLPTDTDIIDLRFGRQTITPAVLNDLTDGGTTTLHNHDGRYPREYAGKTAAPTVSDDSGDGYAIGDLWIDETNDKVYQALNVSVGAAVWIEITGGGGGASVWGSITGTLSDQTDLQAAIDAAEASAKTYADGLVVGLWDDRGSYNASGGSYPSSGGSGTAGAIKKGDVWTISVAGTLPTSQVVEVGDVVRALVDTPGNTQANWAITQNNIGYTAENSANKATTITGNESSTTLYATTKAVVDWVKSLFLNIDGWIPVSETWTRTGNHIFTVSGDLTSKYRKGVKVKYKDGGSYEYGVIKNSSYSSGTTTVNLVPNTDYAMAATTITDTYISLIDNPEGMPREFNFSPSFTNLTIGNGTSLFKWRNDLKYLRGHVIFGSTSSISGSVTMTTPFDTETIIGFPRVPVGVATLLDASPLGTTLGNIVMSAANTILFQVVAHTTNSVGNNYVPIGALTAIIPFTWTISDEISFFAAFP